MPTEVPSSERSLELNPNLTINDVVQQIQRCVEDDQEIQHELEALLGERQALEAKIDRIMYPAEAHSLKQNMRSLTDKIRDTSVTAYSLSSKVHRLDVTQARLEEAINRVEQIVNLKTTIDKVNVLIEKKEYYEAAKLTNSILHDKEAHMLENDTSVEVLRDLERALVTLVVKECDRAALKAADAAKRKMRSGGSDLKSSGGGRASLGIDEDVVSNADAGNTNDGENDGEEDSVSPEFRRVFELCRILALLDKQHQGLGRYCFAARTMLVLGSRKLQIAKNSTEIRYPDRLSEMLDAIAYCIQLHTNTLRESFGPGSELRLIQELVEECDSKIHSLVHQFIETKKIPKIMKGVQKFRMASLSRDSKSTSQHEDGVKGKGKSGDSGYDPKMLDGLLEEIAYVCREIQIFDFNIRQRGDSARNELKRIPSQQRLWKAMCEDRMKDKLPRTTKVNQLQQELTSFYIVIEEYFMTQDVQTAIELDDNSEQAQTTSMVDDVFYILKKCSERAFSTCDVNSACAIVNLLNSMLETLYKQELSSKLSVCWERSHQITQILFAQDQLKQKQVEDSMILALNNIQVSSSHILTLRKHLLSHTMDVFEHMPNAINMAKQCLEGLSDTSESYMRLVHTYVAKFVKDQVNKVNGPQALGSLLERFGQQKYDLKEVDFASREANDNYIPTLLETLHQQHQSMEGRLTETNMELILHSLATHIVTTIETYAMRKKFTFWGGLQFDKDIRKVSGLFNKLCNKPVRDKFTRLLQIASLLQVDKVEEILDYWTSDAQVWRLSPMDVKAVLSLRVEFSQPAIDALKL
eukprot:CAMPEP_0184493506 /NCGR_PEP_ID=MMETSP0113_2-20130426/26173_1 /TAXON_ID=91329 /ORGANISM="Norrisiella sphaerica, Strain BC52" /LENGTH=808 /DNA_ID=CAMNT_0026878785 /DNA_START=88 /DNA_END=2514 /DNA_ORIENTATION=+